MKAQPKIKKEKKKIKRDIARVLNKDVRVQRKLLMMNPYALSLLDPFNERGARIPDEALYPSVPFTIVDRRTLTVNAQGIAMICYGFFSYASSVSKGSLIPISITGDSTFSYTVGMTHGSAATASDLTAGTFGTTGPVSLKFGQWRDSVTTVQSSFDKVRLVSAGLNIQFTGNFTNNSGKYTVAYGPRGYSRSLAGQAFPISYLAQFPESRTVPISLNQGATIRYEPVDEYSFRYTQIGGAGGVGYQSYPITSAAEWETMAAQAEGGELWCSVDGSVANTTFEVTFVGNYEGIPLSNSYLLSSMAKTSSSDPIALTHALRTTDKVPNVSAGSFEANGTAMTSDTIREEEDLKFHQAPPDNTKEGDMFDQVLDKIAKVPEAYQKVSGVVDKLSPLLEEGLAFLA